MNELDYDNGPGSVSFNTKMVKADSDYKAKRLEKEWDKDKQITDLTDKLKAAENKVDEYHCAMTDHCKNQCEGDARDACYSCQIHTKLSLPSPH